jgi:succinyl-diaminopimelate desuccinylase
VKLIPKEIEKYTVDLLRDLISIETVNPPGLEYAECANLLGKHLEQLGFHVELVSIPDDYLDKYYPYAPSHRGNPRHIVLARKGAGSPVLHFNGHYDVVPAGAGWKKDPFKSVIEEGRIYGRGSSDMKGGIAAVIGCLKHVADSKLKLGGTIEVAFVPDEESGGAGTRYLVDSKRTKPDYVIIAEPTHPPIGGITIGHKGMVRGVVKVLGKQVHGSKPWQGENAFVKASLLISEFLKEYQPLLNSRATEHPVEFVEGKHPTINLGGYAESLSRKDNIVPGEFTFSFDRRVIPEEDIDEVVKELERFFQSAAQRVGARHEVKVLSAVPASVTALDSKIVSVTSKCVKARLNVDPVATIDPGRNDAVFYKKIGVEVVNYGPGTDTNHAPDEYTTIAELTSAVETYTDIIKELLATP